MKTGPASSTQHIACTSASEQHAICVACGACKHAVSGCMDGAGPYEETNTAPILVVSEYPDAGGDTANTPITDENAKILHSALVDAGINPDRCRFTTAVRCRPAGGKLRGKTALKACKHFLLEEIEQVRPRAILLLGNTPLQALLGRNGVTSQRRRLFKHALSDGTEIPTVCAFAPGFVARDQNQRQRFVGDIRFLVSTLKQKKNILQNFSYFTSPTDEMLTTFLTKAAIAGNAIAIDVETNTLNPYESDAWRLFTIAISDGRRTYVMLCDPLGEAGTRDATLAQRSDIKTLLYYLKNTKQSLIAHNAKYEKHVLSRRFGIAIDDININVDTLLMHSMLFPITGGHDLDAAAQEMLGVGKLDALEKYLGKSPTPAKWATIPLDVLVEYNAQDAFITWHVLRKMREKIAANNYTSERDKENLDLKYTLSELFENLITPAAATLCRIEANGFAVDTAYLQKLKQDLTLESEQQLAAIEMNPLVRKHNSSVFRRLIQAHKEKLAAGKKVKEGVLQRAILKEKFNPNSDKQIADILHVQCNVPIHNRTETGLPAMGAETLLSIAERYAKHDAIASLCKALVARAKTEKALSTFVCGLENFICPDGAIHASFNSGVTRTGRLACKDPNLQNVPRDPAYRNLYSVRAGNRLIEADYSQLELRVLAMFCQDPTLIQCFRDGRDIHTETAMEMLGVVDPALVPKEIRTGAKTVNFGIVYMQSAMGLAETLSEKLGRHVDADEAQTFIEAVYSRFPGVFDWQEFIKDYAKKQGYVYTLTGRKRLIGNAQLSTKTKEGWRLVSDAMRQAVNTPVQGTASDFTLKSLMGLEVMLKPLDARVVSTVHDSILVEAPAKHELRVAKIVHKIMRVAPLKILPQSVIDLGVPIDIEVKSGTHWGALSDITSSIV